MRGAGAIRGNYLSRLGLQHRDEVVAAKQLASAREGDDTAAVTKGQVRSAADVSSQAEGSQHDAEVDEERAAEAEVAKMAFFSSEPTFV